VPTTFHGSLTALLEQKQLRVLKRHKHKRIMQCITCGTLSGLERTLRAAVYNRDCQC